jgi:hypothetical protein
VQNYPIQFAAVLFHHLQSSMQACKPSVRKYLAVSSMDNKSTILKTTTELLGPADKPEH